LLARPFGAYFGMSSPRTPCPAEDVGHAEPGGERAGHLLPTSGVQPRM